MTCPFTDCELFDCNGMPDATGYCPDYYPFDGNRRADYELERDEYKRDGNE